MYEISIGCANECNRSSGDRQRLHLHEKMPAQRALTLPAKIGSRRALHREEARTSHLAHKSKKIDCDSHMRPEYAEYIHRILIFLYDETNIKSVERKVPYNSILQLNDTRAIAQNSEFLNLGWGTESSHGSLNLCLCLDEKVLLEDFTGHQRPCYLRDAGYRLGYLAFLVFIDLALETPWLVVFVL